MKTLYCFLATEGLTFLKRGYIPFYSSEKLPEPWLKLGCVYQAVEPASVSEQEFQNYLKGQYENLPAHLKEMVSFEYFQQQSQAKRGEIEQLLMNHHRDGAKHVSFSLESVKGWRILSLFEQWQDIYLWQMFAAQGRGLVLELDVAAARFQEDAYNQQAQHLADIKSVDSWLPTDNLYYFYNRPSNMVLPQISEWRLLRQLDAADRTVSIQGEELAMYRLPTKAIKRVILGYCCEPGYCRELKSYLAQDINYRHTQCVQAQLDPNTLSLGLANII